MTHRPTWREQRLASALEQLREAAGLSKEAVGKALDVSPSTVYRWEDARSQPRLRMLTRILDLYDAEEPARGRILALAGEENGHGWWQPYEDHLTEELAMLIQMETVARVAHTFEASLVPGLLQTEDYARAVIEGRLPHEGRELEQRVKIRMGRQEALSRDPAMSLWVIVDEAVLRREVGGPDVMRSQLQRLVEAANEPHITLQVLPFDIGAHAGTRGSFTLLDFPEAESLGSVVYIESMAGGLFVDHADDVSRFRDVLDRLRVAALSPSETAALLTTLASEAPRKEV